MDAKTRAGVDAFRRKLRDWGEFEALFEYLPDVCFFVKDRQSRLMMGNHALLKLLGQSSMDTVFGRTGYDFFPKGIADAFHEDDRLVMDGDTTLCERVELILDEEGTISWFCTTKIPLYGTDGIVVGLKGITRNLRKADPRLHPFAKLMPAIEAVRLHYREEIDLDALAADCGLSTSQFRRSFKSLFRISPLLHHPASNPSKSGCINHVVRSVSYKLRAKCRLLILLHNGFSVNVCGAIHVADSANSNNVRPAVYPRSTIHNPLPNSTTPRRSIILQNPSLLASVSLEWCSDMR
jgi:AraC-like DNA-binding protein